MKQNNPDQKELSKAKLNVPSQPNQTLVKTQISSQTNKQKTVKNKFPTQQPINAPSKPNQPLPPKPRQALNQNITKPISQTGKNIPIAEIKTNNKLINKPKSSDSAKKPLTQPQQNYSQQPKRPLAPPSRPKTNIQDKKPLQLNNQKPKERPSSTKQH